MIQVLESTVPQMASAELGPGESLGGGGLLKRLFGRGKAS
jgi:hypothetical protein